MSETLNKSVAAVVTAMTDGEKPFLYETVSAIISDPEIGQIIICINKTNSWITDTLNSLLDDSRVELLRFDMAPLPVIRNQSIKPVKLPWVAYCDGDDVWCAGKTTRQLRFATLHQSDFVGADHWLVDEDGVIRASALAHIIPMPSSWLVKTEILRMHLFNPSSIVGSDCEWWARTNGQFKTLRLPEHLIKYRVRSTSNSSTEPSKKRKVQIIRLSRAPILGNIIFALTYLAWFAFRRTNYQTRN